MRIALECQRRGHDIRVYTLIWEGDVPDGFEVLVAPVRSIFNHRRNEKFTAWVRADLARRPVQRVIGFNKMPGLDVYYAADACFEEKAQTLRNPLYRQWGRYRHFAGYERAVFDPASKTEILMISEVQQPLFVKHYGTQAERFHLLPPGISQDRRAPANAAGVRAEFRREFGLEEDDLLLVQIGSGFKTKGLDRSLKALAALPKALRRRTRLIAIGQDDPKPFLLQIAALGLNDQVQILKGRSDIPRFLLGADLLIHPAYNENTGTVLLEALVSGLPVLVTDVCGYAHYIAEADAGRVLPSPFEQDSLNRLLAEMLEDRSGARRLVAQWPGLRRSRRPLQHAAARRRPDPRGGLMRLVLEEPFKRLWNGRDPFEAVEALQGKVYRELEGRRTLRTEVDGRGYFVKIHRGIGWGEIAKNLLTAKLPVLGARQEWQSHPAPARGRRSDHDRGRLRRARQRSGAAAFLHRHRGTGADRGPRGVLPGLARTSSTAAAQARAGRGGGADGRRHAPCRSQPSRLLHLSFPVAHRQAGERGRFPPLGDRPAPCPDPRRHAETLA